MKYRVLFKESVEKDFKKIPKARLRIIYEKIHHLLAEDPWKKGESLKGKWEGLKKFNVPPFRIIYTIFEEQKTILILRIRHRKDVYR